MDEATLAGIEQRANAATAGPWETSVHAMPGATADEWFVREIVHPNGRFHPLNVLKVRGASHAARECCWPPTDADAEFIAHARTDVPLLAAEVRRLSAALAEQRAENQRLHDARERIRDRANAAEAALSNLHAKVEGIWNWCERNLQGGAPPVVRAALATAPSGEQE